MNNTIKTITSASLSEKIVLQSDLAAEFPVYLYLSEDKQNLYYSRSIKALLDSELVKKPLPVSMEGLSFLLQNGAIPPPRTIYTNVYMVGIGDTATISAKNGQIALAFDHQFPFMNANRLKEGEMVPDEDLILEMLAEATIRRIDQSKSSFLFQSAGKDSNMIALALAEAGWQDKVTLVSHKSKGNADESEIAKSIAQKLGIKHQILQEPKFLRPEHFRVIEQYFEDITLLGMDNVTLAYPIYTTQLDFRNSNIIDGSGNDPFIGLVPSLDEYRKQQIFPRIHMLSPLMEFFGSANIMKIVSQSRAEWTGGSGLNFFDSIKLNKKIVNIFSYWYDISQKRSAWDYLDFKAAIRTRITEQSMVILKARVFSDFNNSLMVLPWANEDIAKYFARMPEKYLFDRKAMKNKLILRKILKDRIGLDSDAIGKKFYAYDFWSTLQQMDTHVNDEILRCSLWDCKEIEKLLLQLNKKAQVSGRSRHIIHRLYLLSVWFNHNKYISR